MKTALQTSHFVLSRWPSLSAADRLLDQAWNLDEADQVRFLHQHVGLDEKARQGILEQAVDLVRRVRSRARDAGAMEAFMREYDLSSEEGVVLMCLAEALLRIPDNETAEQLISDKLADADWESHLGKSESLFVNASTWGLMLTGKLVRMGTTTTRNIGATLQRLANKSGEPVIRLAIRQAMRIMGHQYVMGDTIDAALGRSMLRENRRYRYSYDMLGEAALTARDAERYRNSYAAAIRSVGANHPDGSPFAAPSISVKLSALHPRYEAAQEQRVMDELVPSLRELARLARNEGVALTVDAEEAERLHLSLRVFSAVLGDEQLKAWDGLGLALQAYQKRAWAAIDYLAERARATGHRIPIRLVKGAYWDTEIKHAQVEGYAGYPVFTRKCNTDLAYLACARKLLQMTDCFYAQFATHNAHTIAAIAEMAPEAEAFEYQRLHGMGRDLYEEVLDQRGKRVACRVYAPVGNHKDLLPYLVRRLLENGANTSFVNRIVDEKLPPEEVVSDPIEQIEALSTLPHPRIPLPCHLYGDQRLNSAGINFAQHGALEDLRRKMEERGAQRWMEDAEVESPQLENRFNPAALDQPIGTVRWFDEHSAENAVSRAVAAQPAWDALGAAARADILERIGDAFEAHREELMALCVREAGKTLRDALAEVREAIDFCRYYALTARGQLAEPIDLVGPTGETNQLRYHGKGVFVCISPWNFPLAIFSGQVMAALVTGNSVVAKPAEQTPLIARQAVAIMRDCGIPDDALILLPGDGRLGAALTQDPRVAGVAFTGSTETARKINRTLAEREGPLATLIAETGGQNAMVVDSSALPEQVVRDVISSAFHSAGQRCSALRILCLQRDIADRVLEMLAGALDEIQIGDPGLLGTDIGPVIDQGQLDMLEAHARRMDQEAKRVAEAVLPQNLERGYWFAPRAYEIDSIRRLDGEIFGPVLHVLRFAARDLDKLIDDINETGFGLTLGIHSRIDRNQQKIARRIRVGNAYVNRNMTGAVVGVQPFGGEGLSGTGPKAGGPNYLMRFVTERTLTINTAAVGGNASLLALSD